MLDRIAVPTSLDVELKIKLFNQGANAGERLSLGLNGKGLRGNAIGFHSLFYESMPPFFPHSEFTLIFSLPSDTIAITK